MKKIFLLLLIILCMAGCGNNKSETATDDIKIGIISKLNASEEAANNYFKKIEKSGENPEINLSHKYIYYDNLNNLMMALDSGNIDEMSTYKCVALYTQAQNPDIKILDDHFNLYDSFCCAVLKENQKLLLEIDMAIQEMKDDGTLDKIAQEYISDFKTEPPAVAIKNIAGAETIKFGITGDLPPLDLILADDRPAGFNTAVLSEISRRMNKNIELVKIDSHARAAALIMRNVDAIFWVSVSESSLLPENIDTPQELAVSIPYYTDKIVHVGLR